MSALTTLAAAPDAIAPISASVLALASFLVLILLSFNDGPRDAGPATIEASESDQPLEDQVGM